MTRTRRHDELEAQLNDFDPLRAGRAAHDCCDTPASPTRCNRAEVANMHCHTFFSFNAYGYSPTSLAWLARQRGYKLMGIVDFDVLDGVDEFLDACYPDWRARQYRHRDAYLFARIRRL